MLTNRMPADFILPIADPREASQKLAPPPPCPTSEHWVEVDGVLHRYLAGGQGRPLVFLHGLLGYSFSWRFTLPYFAQSFRVIAPDLPGSGFSARRPDLDAALTPTASLTLKFLDAIGVQEFDLLGTSRGGGVAMMLAALAERAQPGRVRRLVLSAPINPWSPVGKLIARLLSHPLGASAFRRATGLIYTHAEEWLGTMYGDAKRVPPGTIDGYRAPFRFPGGFENGLAMLKTWDADLARLERILPEIAGIPTLLVWGSKDNRVVARSGARLQKRMPGSELVMLPGVGHLPYEEVPEEFNALVGDFLSAPETSRAAS